MKIIAVDVFTLRFSYEPENRFRYAGGECTGRLTSLVKIKTDAGLEGIGSSYSHPQLVNAIISDHLSPFLLGKDPLEIERWWTANQNLTQWYGRKGAAISALGAIDIALWDIAGKAKGVSVCELLGGTRENVPVYASGLLWRDRPEDLKREARQHVSRGFRAVKMRIGKNFTYDVDAIRSVRDAIGQENRLIVDGNSRLTPESARALQPILSDANVFWLEEPFAPDNLSAFRDLKQSAQVRLAAGENEFGVQGFETLIANEAVDVIQPDCSRTGGITEAKRIATLAAKHGLGIAPHTWSDAVALTANLHLAASCSNGITVEMDQTGNPFIDDLLQEKLVLRDGSLRVPKGPGLGIALDDAVVARYAIDPSLPVPHGNYSDMVFGAEHRMDAYPYETGVLHEQR